MAAEKKNNVLQDLADGYNKMMEDPLEYAQTTYKKNIDDLGRPYGGKTDARTKANKPWNKNDVPV